MRRHSLLKKKTKFKRKIFNKKFKFSIKKLFSKIKSKVSSSDNNNDYFSICEVIIIILISICFGIAVGAGISSQVNISDNVKSDLGEIVSTYNDLVENYYGELNEDELKEAAIKGMISVLNDPYSSYFDSENADAFNQSLDGEFVGVGVTIEWLDNQFRIVDVLENSPASQAKLQVNDYIVEINNIVTDGLSLDELSNYIQGEKGSKVSIKVKRDDQYLEFFMKRAVVEIKSVHSNKFDNVGYIKIDTFASNTASQFKKELDLLEKNGIKSLIIDVRGNSGGKLSQVDKILELFFKKNVSLYQIDGNDGSKMIYSSKRDFKNYSVVVLTNSCSASASEILASAFKDSYDNSFIVGTNTYGKGTIQKAVKLSSGASIKYTTQKWLTSTGVWVNDVGISPDVYVELDETYYQNPSFDNDLQFQKALELLRNSGV